MEFSFFQNSKLQMEIKALREKLEAFRNGEVYQKLRDRKSTRLNSSHRCTSRMPSSA